MRTGRLVAPIAEPGCGTDIGANAVGSSWTTCTWTTDVSLRPWLVAFTPMSYWPNGVPAGMVTATLPVSPVHPKALAPAAPVQPSGSVVGVNRTRSKNVGPRVMETGTIAVVPASTFLGVPGAASANVPRL